MLTDNLIPNIEHRLSTWIRIQERLKKTETGQKPTITISRQFGAEAFPLAETLQRPSRKEDGRLVDDFRQGPDRKDQQRNGPLRAIVDQHGRRLPGLRCPGHDDSRHAHS